MTVYAWSTITTTQGLTFTGDDTLAFDTGGRAIDVQVSMGWDSTTLTYDGKSIALPNSALHPDRLEIEFLFLDASRLEIDAQSSSGFVSATLGYAGDQYVSPAASTNAINDTVDGGYGNDLLRLGAGDDTALGGYGDDSINGELGNDTLEGGAGNDTLVTGDGFNMAFGDSGDDSIVGGSRPDWLDGGIGSDHLWGGDGNNTLAGDAGADILDAGGDGNNSLSGGDDDDYLYARGGNDTLDGGAGSDTLTGGAGADLFVFDNVTDSSNSRPDMIVDFQHGVDKIDLHKIAAGLTWGGATPTAHGVWYTISPTVTVIHIDTHTSYVGSDATINLYGTNLGLTAADFIL